jgi:DNA-binding transcriptional MerR regulator
VQELPKKDYYKVSEVCRHTDTQPYVLRFWESEFPQLKPRKTSGGQSVYSRRDVDLIVRIKKLLDEDEFSIADARKALDKKASGKSKKAAAPRGKAPAKKAPARSAAKEETGKLAELRRRYDAACGEIVSLRQQLSEASDSGNRVDKARAEIKSLREKLAAAEADRDHHAERAEMLEDTMKKASRTLKKLTGAR